MTDDETLDKIMGLFKLADEHSDQADLLLAESENQQKMAEDIEDAAEALWKPLVEQHPEWADALRTGVDPRVPPDGAEETLAAIISEGEARALDGNR